jgi:adenylate cyclase class 2
MKTPKSVEIELKAKIVNPKVCKKSIESFAGKGTLFSKDDSYWFAGRNSRKLKKFPSSGLRLRQNKSGKTLQSLVTWKYKERRNGLEINEEHEFELKSGDEFEQLLEMLSLEKRIIKHKNGWVWHYNGISAELCEVSGFIRTAKNLGWFLELEILSDKDSAKTAAAAKKKLLAFLEKAGIGKENIEDRYYAEMLAELA